MNSESTLYIATIMASLPEIGLAVVTKEKSAANLSNLIIAYLPYGDSAYGATPVAQFAVGSSVLCVSNNDHPVAYIVGCLNDKPCNDRNFGGELFYHVGKVAEKICTLDLNAERRLLTSMLHDLTDYIRNSRGNSNGDSLPGDFDITDTAGLVGLHVGRLLSALRGSPLAFVDVSAITHKVRMVGKTLEFHTLAGEISISDNLTVMNTASSVREAMGLLNDTAVKTVDDIPDALPFYRLQSLRGAAAAGVENTVLTPPEDTELHTQAEQPLMLNKHRTSVSGEEQLFSAHSIGSIKTPDIYGILQARYGTGSDSLAKELRTPFDQEETEDSDLSEDVVQDDATAVDDAALHQSKRYASDYTDELRKLLATEGLAVGENTLSDRAKADVPKNGPTAESAYPLPPSLKITDPCTGREHTYFLSTSFIRQLEDGSIIIADGYGSEIRLSRGNIYIASALDTFVRPGRDCIQMVPRNLVLNTQGRGILNAKGSLYFRASEDLKIANTGENNGHLTIECRSADGISIRSNGSLSITCTADMYIGRNRHSNNAFGTTTEPELSGSIVVDAGKRGMITQIGGECSMDAQNVYLKAHDSGRGTLFMLSPAKGIVGVPELQITGTVVMQRFSGPLTMICHENNYGASITVEQVDSCDLLISGSAQVGGSVKVDGSLVAVEQIVANKLANASGQVDGKIPDKSRPKADFPNAAKAPVGIGKSAEDGLVYAAEGAYQDAFIMNNAFAFPNSEDYGIPANLRMPAMLWQVNSGESGKTWQELPVRDELSADGATYCYPGERWESGASIGDDEYGNLPLKDNYRTNTH